VKIVVEKGTTSIAKEKHFSILETRPKLEDELITLLKNMHATRQGLFAPTIQSIIKRIFDNRALELLKDFTKRGGFKVFLEWTRDFMKLVLPNIHNSSKEITINMGDKRDIHGTSSCLPCQNVQHISMCGCQQKSN
jgi:hypothetical protein